MLAKTCFHAVETSSISVDEGPNATSISVAGELYGGKGQFNNFQALFNGSNTSDPQWRQASYIMFDVRIH